MTTIEKIRAEIRQKQWHIGVDSANQVIEIIDKYAEQEPCSDAVSRQAVIEMAYDMSEIDGEHFNEPCMVVDVKDIQKLPPVTPQEPKTGHWIEQDGFDGDTYYDCSECGESFCLIDGTPTDNLYNYCPNCGARMESEA